MREPAKIPDDSSSDSDANKKRKEKRCSSNSPACSSSLLDSEKPLARGKISIFKKTLHSIETSLGKDLTSAPSAQVASNTEIVNPRAGKRHRMSKVKSTISDTDQAVVDDIWSRLDKNEIDLGYAIVGFGSSGRPILDHDIFITLLINYGYKIDHVLAFIDDFNDMSEKDDSFPIVMMSAQICNIYDSVEPLSGSIYKKFGENQ